MRGSVVAAFRSNPRPGLGGPKTPPGLPRAGGVPGPLLPRDSPPACRAAQVEVGTVAGTAPAGALLDRAGGGGALNSAEGREGGGRWREGGGGDWEVQTP
ncbi:hypothetical protein P7K49_015938 [Saguinus oedipus]|uniref:Uncharacterized protein n=1 Tax=Saguinus oedipus TaxID=9490 RepID=A0ABQ9VAM8_SAGOE|nr:hypothetical protein P7K49_015938 [Saguinus oedipus]